MLNIIVNSSNNIEIGQGMKQWISAAVESRLGRFEDQLSRVEVHIGDEDGHKTGENDKRCMMEARPEGMHTLNVTTFASSVEEAVKSAGNKMERMIDSAFGALKDSR